MKRNYASKAIKSSLLLCCALFTTSCSSLWLHRDQTVDSVRANGVSSTVPKEQYDEYKYKLLPIDFTDVYAGMAADAIGEKYCSTDFCEVPKP